MKTLTLEVKENTPLAEPNMVIGDTHVMVTPAIDEDFWLFRVKVSEDQAVVGFPKFGTFGIGYQYEEESWNTNLPYTCPAEEILAHIACNKGDESIPDEQCLEAIEIIKNAIRRMKDET